MTRVRTIKLVVHRTGTDSRYGVADPGPVVIDADGLQIPVTPDVAWELKGELMRLGPLFRAKLLFDEDNYRVIDVVETSGPTLYSRLCRVLWRIFGYVPT